MRKINCIIVILVIGIYVATAFAQEHPGIEHPGIKTEEHPGKETLSVGQIKQGIIDYITQTTKKEGGFYPLYDEKEGKELRLKFVRVHDRVSYIKKEDAYFACADFITDDGRTTYDIDFWMKRNLFDKLKVLKTIIHKKDGLPRHTYKDDEIVPFE